MMRAGFYLSAVWALCLTLMATPAAAQTFEISGIRFDRSSYLDESDLRAVSDPYVGRQIGFADLQLMLEELNALYLTAGIPTARAILPPQEIRDGILRVSLVEATVSELVFEGMPTTSDAFMERNLSLRIGEKPDFQQLERDLIIFDLAHDIRPQLSFGAGDAPGTTRATVTAEEPKRFEFTGSLDNFGRPETGDIRGSLFARWNSPTGVRDVLSFQAQGSEGAASATVGYSRPVGGGGGRAVAVLSYSQSEIIGGDFSPLRIESDKVSGTLGYRRPVRVRAESSVMLDFGVAYEQTTSTVSGIEFADIEIADAYFSAAYTRRAALDLETVSGDIHLNETDGIILENVVAGDGLIDIFSAGDTEIGTIRAFSAAPIVLSTSTGDMVADDAVIAGGDTRIFALAGALRGRSSDTFRADTLEGTTLHLFAQTNLRYAETRGDLRVGFALADQGDLAIDAQDGSQSIGVLGAAGALTLRARDNLRVSMIGETTVDLADEVALALINPAVYGLRDARSPQEVDLLTQTAGGAIFVGLVGVQNSLDLVGDRIDLLIHDVAPAGGLVMTVMDAADGLADRVDIASVGAGAKLFIADGDYFDDPRPRLLDRGRTDGARGTLTLTRGYIGTGDISHAGPTFVGDDIRIGGDVWFRQRNFDLLATAQYASLSTVADAQALAFYGGEMTFDIRDGIILKTIAPGKALDGSGGSVLLLNRRLGGIDLNGGQGYAFGTGVDTDILSFPVVYSERGTGITTPLVIRKMMDQYDTGTMQFLNGFVTQDDCRGISRCPSFQQYGG